MTNEASAVVDTDVKAGLKTCLITLVTPGGSDRVLKVFPAQHEKEKIWLDNARGIERWEAVERLLNNFAERGTRVPKPAPWHSDSKQMLMPDLKPEDIPLVRLDGAVLEAPPEEGKIDYSRFMNNSTVELGNKINQLESNVSQLAAAVSSLAASLQSSVEKPKVGRPRKEEK